VRDVPDSTLSQSPELRGKPFRAFQTQRKNARARGIEWRLTLLEWWAIWQNSGNWEQRGLGQGKYVMSRIGDKGPYAAGNVFIALCIKNSSDTPHKLSGLPIGVVKHDTRFVAKRMIRGKIHRLGSFGDPETAALAYRLADPSRPSDISS